MSRFILAAVLSIAAPAFAQTAYFAEIDDLPLAPGLSETQSVLEFDGGGDGRIVETSALGASTPEAVRRFYAESLPALGWSFSPSANGPMQFLRGREELSLTVREQAGAVRLDARLITRPASMRVD